MPVDSRVIIYGLANLISKPTSYYFASAGCPGQQAEPGHNLENERISLLNIVFFVFRACFWATRTRIIIALRLQLYGNSLNSRTTV